jgi:hypothetical protein
MMVVTLMIAVMVVIAVVLVIVLVLRHEIVSGRADTISPRPRQVEGLSGSLITLDLGLPPGLRSALGRRAVRRVRLA